MSAKLASVLAIATIAMPATAAPRARGKVVRVERARNARTAARVCDLGSDRTGTCLGSKPEVGESVTILDESGIVAEARIVDVSPYTARGSTASCQTLWNIRAEVVRGDLASMTSRTVGLIDRDLHPSRAHMLSRDKFPAPPSGRADDTVMVAVDRDGDRTPDLLITQGQCDSNSSPGGPCIDQWALVNAKLTRVHQTNFAACGF